MINAAKAETRLRLLEARRRLAFEDVYRLSAMAQERLIAAPVYRAARRIALYASFRNEVLTDEVFQKADADGKEISYPRIIRGGGRRIAFFKVGHLGELASGSYEIREPSASDIEADAASLDLVVVPGVAFDLAGGRLGYGKGYYDMALAGVRCPVAALAYDFQVIKEPIPAEPHDIKVSFIITETRVICIDKVGKIGG